MLVTEVRMGESGSYPYVTQKNCQPVSGVGGFGAAFGGWCLVF